MKKRMWIAVNLITGLFVVINSVVGYGISGMGEGSTNNVLILGLIVIWAIGLVLQMQKRVRIVGLILTFIPVVFIVYIYLMAIGM